MKKNWLGILLVLLLGVDLGAQSTVPSSGWSRRPIRGQDPEPLDWGLEAAAHLMRRAGFSASPAELNLIVTQGFEETLNQLIDFEQVNDSAMEQALAARNYPVVGVDPTKKFLYIDNTSAQNWWLFRMLNSRRQLLEKMTFFWHDHFATSSRTVGQVDGNGEPLMIVQNRTLRDHALGNFRAMVKAIARDPAMILWLDNFTNVEGNPNENWARELLELFTMGEGNGYTEFDIQEAARAFTGWSLVPRRRRAGTQTQLTFLFDYRLHDPGSKTFLGTEIEAAASIAGLNDGGDVIDIIFQHPAVAEFLVTKLWNFFVYPEPPPTVVRELARLFRDLDYELKPLMRAIFSHPHFMSERALRAKIKSPVEFMVGAYREFAVTIPDNISRLTRFYGLGQTLFQPPDVGGWTQDEGWINTGSVLARFNFTTFMSVNRPGEPFQIVGVDRLIRNPFADQIPLDEILPNSFLETAEQVVDHFLRTMVQNAASLDTRYALEEYMQTGSAGEFREFDINNPDHVDEKVRGLIFLVSLLPVYQLN